MREHDTTAPGPDEPEEGWQTAEPLVDSQILSIVLCRFTGEKPLGITLQNKPTCSMRALAKHEDVDCLTLYHQADALRSGKIHYDMPGLEVTVPVAGGEPTYKDPV